ncbi:hypothetical protein [Pseudomonas sp. BN417]|uniref:hypothetical protein n=1 Tax=Pseudomonas sp. BN417 TaxID=2567890 RepID=UPI0024585C59|nr:hypothetical protein [Pseudomonas sp. BN417]
MRLLKCWAARRAAHLARNAELVAGLQPAKAAVQAALRELDVEVTPLGMVLRLWWLARCINRCGHHSRKMRELQEVANALRN